MRAYVVLLVSIVGVLFAVVLADARHAPSAQAHEDGAAAPNGRSPWSSSESWTLTHSWGDSGHCDYLLQDLSSLACQSSTTPNVIHVNAYYAQDFANGCDKAIYPIWDTMTVVNDHTQPGQADRLVLETTIGGTRYQTEYLHMNSVTAALGATVNSNTVVGTSGNVGISSGCHLHVVVRRYHTADSRFYSVPATLCSRTYPPSVVGTSFAGCATNPDTDGDGIPDSIDNCDGTPNPGQANNDSDPDGDACDPNCSATDEPLMGDVNGDGRADAVAFQTGLGRWNVALSTGAGFAGFTDWLTGHGVGSCQRFLGDADGDGRDDAIVFIIGDGSWYVARSTGSSFAFPELWATGHGVGSGDRLVGDVTGDGRVDAVAILGVGEWWVNTSTGGGFGGAGQWRYGHGVGSTKRFLGDADGNGKDDAVVFVESTGSWYVGLSDGASFGFPGTWKAGHGVGSTNQFLGDATGGDGADAVAYLGVAEWWVTASMGLGFGDAGQWIVGHGVGSTAQLFADATGDGRSDAVVYRASDGCWFIARSAVTFFNYPGNWTCGLPGTNGDLDGDAIADTTDNCLSILNASQVNADTNYVDNSPPYADTVDDKTWANSDAAGNACDTDDDNDGRSDADEATGSGCAGAVTNPLLRDTDGDRFLDGAECALSTDPTSAVSKPAATLVACGPAGDTDGDRISDRIEFCYYGTNPNNTDSDGDKALDGAKDGCEVVSVNTDRVVNSGDQGMLAGGISHIFAYHPNIDLNKDGTLNSGDQGLMASFISPPGQCPG